VGVHACCFRDIGVHDCHCLCFCTLTTFPADAHAHPLLPLFPYIRCVPPPDNEARGGGGSLYSCAIFQTTRPATCWPHLRLARVGTDSVCLCACLYLLHTQTRPHTRPPSHTTPLHTKTLHSHLPLRTPTPHSHLYFGYKLPAPVVSLDLISVHANDIATLYIHTNHSVYTRKHPTPTPLGKVYMRDLVVTSSSPRQRVFVCWACTDTAQVGV